MPKKATKLEEVEMPKVEVKSFEIGKVVCVHRNQAEVSGLNKCLDCGETL